MKESELTDTALQNDDYSTRNKPNAGATSENGSTKGNAGATSGPIVEATDLQNRNDTAIRITDTVPTKIYCEPQLQVTAKDSVSVHAHSESLHVQNGTVPNSDLDVARKESACVEALSMFMTKENDVRDANNRNV